MLFPYPVRSSIWMAQQRHKYIKIYILFSQSPSAVVCILLVWECIYLWSHSLANYFHVFEHAPLLISVCMFVLLWFGVVSMTLNYLKLHYMIACHQKSQKQWRIIPNGHLNPIKVQTIDFNPCIFIPRPQQICLCPCVEPGAHLLEEPLWFLIR